MSRKILIVDSGMGALALASLLLAKEPGLQVGVVDPDNPGSNDRNRKKPPIIAEADYTGTGQYGLQKLYSSTPWSVGQPNSRGPYHCDDGLPRRKKK